MNFKELIEELFNKYKAGKCRCIIKGGNEPSLVIKRNILPYFISNHNSRLNTSAHTICQNDLILNSIFIASILSKVYNNELNFYLGYELIKNYNSQEFFNGIFAFIFFRDYL